MYVAIFFEKGKNYLLSVKVGQCNKSMDGIGAMTSPKSSKTSNLPYVSKNMSLIIEATGVCKEQNSKPMKKSFNVFYNKPNGPRGHIELQDKIDYISTSVQMLKLVRPSASAKRRPRRIAKASAKKEEVWHGWQQQQ